MARFCPICGAKIGFFSGRFIKEAYVCKDCYELYLKNIKNEESDHTLVLLSKAYANECKYRPWPWAEKKEENKK